MPTSHLDNDLILILIAWNSCQWGHGGKYFHISLPQPLAIYSGETCPHQSLNNHGFALLDIELITLTQVQVFLHLLHSHFQLQGSLKRCEVMRGWYLHPQLRWGTLSYYHSRDTITESKCKTHVTFVEKGKNEFQRW